MAKSSSFYCCFFGYFWIQKIGDFGFQLWIVVVWACVCVCVGSGLVFLFVFFDLFVFVFNQSLSSKTNGLQTHCLMILIMTHYKNGVVCLLMLVTCYLLVETTSFGL